MTKTVIIFSIIFMILIGAIFINKNKNENEISSTKEGFNTYFRQTIRPHFRTVRSAHETITYHFNNKFNNFVNNLGISY